MSLDATLPTDSTLISELPEYIREARALANSNEAAIGGDYSRQVVAKNVSESLVDSDLNQVITVNSAASVTLTLPAVDASDVGKWMRVHKMNVGDLVITAGSTDVIAGGDPGTIISNTFADEPKLAFLELEVVAAGYWMISGILGTWS